MARLRSSSKTYPVFLRTGSVRSACPFIGPVHFLQLPKEEPWPIPADVAPGRDRLMKTLQGHLLIAPPHERDLDFIRTVILLIQHSEEQAFGVVLNRPSTTMLRQVWRGRCRCGDDLLYSGGPVSGPLMALHTDPFFGEIDVLPSVFYSVQMGRLKELFDTQGHQVKVFQSHVGWGPGQLERFLEDGHWRILPATAEHVFSVGISLWEEVSKLANKPS